jgi:outer membrane protein TolC
MLNYFLWRARILKNLAWVMGVGIVCLTVGCAVIPVPLTPEDLERRVQDDLTQLTQYQEPVSRSITLYEAMARAIRFNLEARVQGLKEMVAHRQLELAHYDLLPKVVADAGYTGRSNFAGAQSRSLLSGQTSLEPSTSSEKNVFTANLTLSWDILDFGLSYVRAQQASNDVLIAEEDKRRIANRVIQEVRAAFWKALGAERVLGRLSFLDDWVSHALGEAQIIRARALETPLTSLQYERELLQAQQEIQQLHQDLSVSRIQLGELMNLEPGEPYELVQPERTPPASKVRENLEELERKALLNRPELRSVDYQKRINAKETKVAILELLPSLNVYLGENYDSNSFLFNNNWLSYGAKVSWNLLNVFRHPTRLQVIDAQKEVLNAQSLALTMTIMTQVHVAVAQYEASLEDVKLTQRYFDTQMKIADHVNQSWSLNRLSEHMVIREKVQGLLAELRYEMALAKLEMAYANLLAAIGEDPFPVTLSDEEVDQLAGELQQRWEWLGQHASVSQLEPEQMPPVTHEQVEGGVQP